MTRYDLSFEKIILAVGDEEKKMREEDERPVRRLLKESYLMLAAEMEESEQEYILKVCL